MTSGRNVSQGRTQVLVNAETGLVPIREFSMSGNATHQGLGKLDLFGTGNLQC
jgi:hypothetical protein